MSFIPKDERPSLALLAGLEDEQTSELAGALSTASAELGGDELVEHVVKGTPSVTASDVKRVLKAVRQVASAREILEVRPEVFLNDVAEGMGEIEEKELRLDETGQRRLRERLSALTESPAVEVHAKARSLRHDRENTYCDHGSNWLPPADDVSNLARNYATMLPGRAHGAAAGNAYIPDAAARFAARADHRTELRRRFERYADEWRARTAHLSVLSQRVMHPSYQRIIGLGPEALPLIIERLVVQPDHWFWALSSISGEDPARPEDAGRFDAMRKAWIDWGQKRGLL